MGRGRPCTPRESSPPPCPRRRWHQRREGEVDEPVASTGRAEREGGGDGEGDAEGTRDGEAEGRAEEKSRRRSEAQRLRRSPRKGAPSPRLCAAGTAGAPPRRVKERGRRKAGERTAAGGRRPVAEPTAEDRPHQCTAAPSRRQIWREGERECGRGPDLEKKSEIEGGEEMEAAEAPSPARRRLGRDETRKREDGGNRS